jgi:hypothetical protein
MNASPFAMAILDEKLEIAMYGPYNEWFAREMNHVPLYTHPHKELSDEEILKFAQSELVGWACDEDVIDFARAIIKASRGEEC